MSRKKNVVTEYVITYKNGDEFITENKKEADTEFDKTDKRKVKQYFSKDWVLVDEEYQEDYVEVYFG